MKKYNEVSQSEFIYDLSKKASKTAGNSTFVIWVDSEGHYVGTDERVKPCEATGNCFNIGDSLQDVINFYEEQAKASAIMEMEQEINAYNEFDGQAILTIDNDDEVSCTVGQSECCVPGYKVLASKLLKEEQEFWVTPEEILEKIDKE